MNAPNEKSERKKIGAHAQQFGLKYTNSKQDVNLCSYIEINGCTLAPLLLLLLLLIQNWMPNVSGFQATYSIFRACDMMKRYENNICDIFLLCEYWQNHTLKYEIIIIKKRNGKNHITTETLDYEMPNTILARAGAAVDSFFIHICSLFP